MMHRIFSSSTSTTSLLSEAAKTVLTYVGISAILAMGLGCLAYFYYNECCRREEEQNNAPPPPPQQADAEYQRLA